MNRLRRVFVRWLMPEIDRQMYRQLSRGTVHTIAYSAGTGGKLTTTERTIGPSEVE